MKMDSKEREGKNTIDGSNPQVCLSLTMCDTLSISGIPFTIFDYTGSITPFRVEQKVNIIVTLVEITITFCALQNIIIIKNFAG
jgi:hypothetical protein